MKKTLVLSLVILSFATNAQAFDCTGTWDLVANGFNLEIHIVGAGGNNFSGTIIGNEPTTRVYNGSCNDSDHKITFLRQSNPIGKWEQYYEGYFWRKNNKTGAAGSFSQNTGHKRSFYMLKK